MPFWTDTLSCSIVERSNLGYNHGSWLSHQQQGNAVQGAQKSELSQFVVPMILTACHGVLWIVFFGFMLRFVPAYKHIFEDFGTALPGMTQLTIWLSSLMSTFWYLAVLFLVGLLVVDLVVLLVILPHRKYAVLNWLWLTLMFLAPIGLTGFTAVAVFVPMAKLMSSLS
jgi:hypothetical protein